MTFSRSTLNGIHAKDALRQLENSVTLTPYENGEYPTRPGLKVALSQHPDPVDFMRTAAQLYRKWKAVQPDAVEEVEENGGETVGTTLEEAEESAWAEIEKYLKSINPYDLQSLVAALLKGMGYHLSWVSPPGPDKGIDTLAYTDPLGTQNPRIKVQVKRHAESVAVDGLRSFLALLNDQDVGIFVATGGFTSTAAAEARTQENRKITLLDLESYLSYGSSTTTKLARAKRDYCRSSRFIILHLLGDLATHELLSSRSGFVPILDARANETYRPFEFLCFPSDPKHQPGLLNQTESSSPLRGTSQRTRCRQTIVGNLPATVRALYSSRPRP